MDTKPTKSDTEWLPTYEDIQVENEEALDEVEDILDIPEPPKSNAKMKKSGKGLAEQYKNAIIKRSS